MPESKKTTEQNPAELEVKKTDASAAVNRRKSKLLQAFSIGDGFPGPIKAAFDLLTPHPIEAIKVPLMKLFKETRDANYLGAPLEATDVERELKSNASMTTKKLILALEIELVQKEIEFQQVVNSKEFLKALLEYFNLDSMGFEFRGKEVKIDLRDGEVHGQVVDPAEQQATVILDDDDKKDLVGDLGESIEEESEFLAAYHKELDAIQQEAAGEYLTIMLDTPEAQANRNALNQLAENPEIANDPERSALLKNIDRAYIQGQKFLAENAAKSSMVSETRTREILSKSFGIDLSKRENISNIEDSLTDEHKARIEHISKMKQITTQFKALDASARATSFEKKANTYIESINEDPSILDRSDGAKEMKLITETCASETVAPSTYFSEENKNRSNKHSDKFIKYGDKADEVFKNLQQRKLDNSDKDQKIEQKVDKLQNEGQLLERNGKDL